MVDEPAGFREYVTADSRALLRAAWLLTGDWASAEDLVQTALAKAWQRWPRAMRDGSPGGYVRAIMTTTFLASRRRRWTGEQPVESVPDTAERDEYEQVDARRTLLTALGTLSPQQRAAIVLRYFADLTEADTAAAPGCSVGAVKSHTSRALVRLRDEPAVAAILSGGVSS